MPSVRIATVMDFGETASRLPSVEVCVELCLTEIWRHAIRLPSSLYYTKFLHGWQSGSMHLTVDQASHSRHRRFKSFPVH